MLVLMHSASCSGVVMSLARANVVCGVWEFPLSTHYGRNQEKKQEKKVRVLILYIKNLPSFFFIFFFFLVKRGKYTCTEMQRRNEQKRICVKRRSSQRPSETRPFQGRRSVHTTTIKAAFTRPFEAVHNR